MKSKRKYLSRVMLFSSALVLAFLATNTAQAEEHNDVFYSRYRPGFNYYNPRFRNNDTLVITIHGITIMSFIGMEITTIKTKTETIMSTRMVGGNSITKMALIN